MKFFKKLLLITGIWIASIASCTTPTTMPPDTDNQIDRPGVDDAEQDSNDSSSNLPTFDLDRVLSSTWLVMGSNDVELVTATAFAIEGRFLSTNGHVVLGLAEILSRPEGVALVVQHETGESLEVVDLWVHPEFTGDPSRSPDIGIIEVGRALPTRLSVSENSQMQSLGVFDEIRMCGFPGDVFSSIDVPAIVQSIASGEVFRPRATCLEGSITSLRPLDPSESATPNNTLLIQHNVATTQGTSGSALLALNGLVIAINAASTTDPNGLNRFAIRADALSELLYLISSAQVVPIALAPPQPFCPGIIGEPSSTFDSDRDGYSDSNEYYAEPGSNPCDSSDIPLHPRDTDGDGCSDFDETYFAGFCDDNPFSRPQFPRPIIVAGGRCTLQCIQYLLDGELFCDSDCDGWYDEVEAIGGFDPCSPFSPSFSPSTPASVCEQLGNLTSKTQTMGSLDDSRQAFLRQRAEILP